MSDRLSAKVRAVNKANAEANSLHHVLADIFRPYIGQKIILGDGRFIKAIRDKLPEFPHSSIMQIYRYFSDYNIVYIVKTCEMINDEVCLYHETSIYVGSLRDQVLTSISEFSPKRVDYNENEISQAFDRANQLRKNADLIDGMYNEFA